MSGTFGFGTGDFDGEENENKQNSGGPDFNEIFSQFASMGFNPQTLFAAAANPLAPLISLESLREISRKFLSTAPELPVGDLDLAKSEEALGIANTWLDQATVFPASAATSLVAASRRDWLDASLPGWQKMLEPLAEGMAGALTSVLNESPVANSPELAGITPIMRAFMGSLIASQLGQSIGQLATSVTGANDVAIPLFSNTPETSTQARLIPQNIDLWAQGLEIPIEEVRIFLAIREAASARLFAHTPWLAQYIQDAITAYGRGIRIDMASIQDQAERAMESGELDITNPQSLSVAINAGLFKPEQSAAQEAALIKLEMALALIEGWIDNVTTIAVANRLPSYGALSETLRRRRATKSPTQQLFATLLGLEVSPRKLRECATFWSEVESEIGLELRDQRWEDAALLPTANDLVDVKKFLASTIVPDDLSGLI
ncbi:MAG: zinc-dependent metalloprotease [Actinobacteria bacterium]|jgi:putative hydrolase|nr:zinc-dependent metalloprotease [Actinomycetota bacterium]